MTSNKCTQCGLVNFATATECKRCHVSFAAGGEDDGANSIATNSPSFQGSLNSSSSAVGQSRSEPLAAGLYYQPSGEVTLTGIVVGMLGGLAVGVVVAFLYSYIITYLPFVYFNFLCSIAYTALLGATIGGLMKWCKVRNTGMCVFVSTVVALVSYYISWAVWLSIMISTDKADVSSLTLAQHPLILWDVILKVNETGAWSMFTLTFSGFALWIVWLAEAVIILGGTPIMAWGVLTSKVFCESCNSWCEDDNDVVSLSAAESAELRRRFESKDFEYLKSVGVKADDAASWYRLELHNCPSCINTNALTVKLENVTVDSKGKAKVSSSSFMEKLLLSANEVNQLRQISSELKRTQQAA